MERGIGAFRDEVRPISSTEDNPRVAVKRERPASVVEAFSLRARAAPQEACLRFEGEALTYSLLLDRVSAFAAALQTWGLERGDRVALFLGNHPDFLVAHLGTHLAGGVTVPVNKSYRKGELRHVFEDAGVRLCVTDAEARPELEQVRGDLTTLQKIVERGEEFDSFVREAGTREVRMPRADDLAVIAYTSGTTGRSKGAMLLHRNLLANARAICEAWDWTGQDRLLLTLPLFHTHGLMVGLHGTLIAGASVDLRRAFDAAETYDALLTGDFTMFFGVPTMYTRLLREAERRTEKPPPLRLYVSGSAPLSPQAFEEFESRFGQRLLERYGMTETGMNLTNPYDGERRPGTVGAPFPGQEARVVDLKTGDALPAEEVGEIEVRGPHVFAGYWERPEATAESFDEGGWFRTGDLGSVSEDGYFEISGRRKELIISGGYNVYPREVEERIEGCPGVADVAVVGLPDEEYGERVAAAVVRDDDALTAEDVVAFCREELAGYKKPREVTFVRSLPRNALGKVLKHEVREQLIRGER